MEWEKLETLADGWNSYSAKAPSKLAIANAKEFVSLAPEPDRIEPSAMGGVGVTFKNDSRKVYVEFYNNGTAHSLFCDREVDDMDTYPVPTNTDGYRAIIDGMKGYLNEE